MKKFNLKIALFLLPIILVLLPPVLYLSSSKENFTNIDAYLKSDKKYLIGYAYNESNYKYIKWYTLQEKDRFDVLALGASRVLQFREEMFTKSFYNAGFSIYSLNDILPFLKTIPKKKQPNILLLSLDQFMFNEASDDLKITKKKDFWKKSFNKYPNGATVKSFYRDYFKGKLNYESSSETDDIHKIGLNALINNKGYRNDGSMFYGRQLDQLLNDDPKVTDYQFKESLEKVKKGTGRFAYGNNINEKALIELEKILSYCEVNNIFVVAFIPPFADVVSEAIESSGRFEYTKKIIPAIQPIFDKYKFEIYDFSSASLCNSDDSEVIDGVHPGEGTSLKMLIDMVENNSVLKNVTKLKNLKHNLQNRINRYTVYDY